MAIKLADTLAPMADFPAAMAKDVWFSDNESLQEKFDNGDFSSSGELHGATIAITSTSVELIGQRVTLSKNGAVVKTRTFNENLTCNFTGIQEAGEYTVSASDGETLKEKTVTITSDDVLNKTVIAVEIQLGNQLQNWIEAGRVTQSFSTLNEVLASEITVRQLMTIHASVNVLKEWMLADPSIVDTFVANATAMKWLGLRDYAYDTLTAGVDGLEEKILASDNWEYALKDRVPVMTSNTAPYGEVIYNSVHDSGPIYCAFDNDNNTYGHTYPIDSISGMFYIGYKFVMPIRVKRVFLKNTSRIMNKMYIQASNDGETWKTLYETTNVLENEYTFDVNNEDYYLYYRIASDDVPFTYGDYAIAVYELQFYGRSLNVSVPKMTSNTAPYGEAFGYNGTPNSQRLPYMAFDRLNIGSDNEGCTFLDVNNKNVYIGYTFPNACVIKYVYVYPYYAASYGKNRTRNFIIVGSNNKTDWVNLSELISLQETDTSAKYIQLNNTTEYKHYAILITDSGSKYACGVNEMNFYGVDYSEREFAEGSTMSYIYDHGIIFNDFIGGLNYVKYINPSESLLEDTYARVGTNTILQTNNMVDLSKYSMVCVKSVLYNPTPNSVNYINAHCIWNVKISTWQQTGDPSIREGELKATAQDECGPTVRCLDISSITKMCVLAMQCGESATTEFTEWWLE